MSRDVYAEKSGMIFDVGNYEIVKETDKAWLIKLVDPELDFQEWLPKSQAEIDPEEKLFIPDWLWDKYN